MATAFALSNGVFARIFPLAPAPILFTGIGLLVGARPKPGSKLCRLEAGNFTERAPQGSAGRWTWPTSGQDQAGAGAAAGIRSFCFGVFTPITSRYPSVQTSAIIAGMVT